MALLVLLLGSTFVPLGGSSSVEGTPISIACGNAWQAWEMGGNPQAFEITEGFEALSQESMGSARARLFDAVHSCERWARVRIIALAGLSLAALIWGGLVLLGARESRP